MSQFQPFIAGHEELIHDLNYDFYGKRIVTCSSDQYIKVFDKKNTPLLSAPNTTENGEENSEPEWKLCDSWKAHDSSIVKVVWANPEFGQVIASCSYDATVRVFEEDPREPFESGRRWKKCATITDFHGAVYDIAFAPSHMGLKLASIDSEGIFHIHEAPNPNNLRFWTPLMPEEALVTKQASKNRQSSFSLSWCPSMFFKEYIAVSAQDSAYIYHRSPGMGSFKRVAELPDCKSMIRSISWAPSMGRGFQLIATGSNDGQIRIYRVIKTKSQSGQSSQQQQVSQSVPQQGQQGQPGQPAQHFDSMDIDSGLDSMASSTQGTITGSTGGSSDSPVTATLAAAFQGHDAEIWRVSWNVTGTILASAGSDGNIKFWKSSYNHKFQCMAVVSAEQRGGNNAFDMDGNIDGYAAS
ncbi:uncharacterized protein SAPINGB_P002091 [Magnusiomyces paraingens]|uniref:Anaphase-promoting complex subunit 4 WD40 domain-containing protein n=1 Tax=Magnusiomyces paraingens TaxID=2606893 RepID=A0A5E8BHS1_9ASCO|nr:uncharacterized protein SAPINGB_P002091 [Saprochaete ingens]VVT49075.1 unnamed protein product [Saprochaete ingens]